MTRPVPYSVKTYLSSLSERTFQTILENFFRDVCGDSLLRQSAEEHGIDISALIEKDKDLFRKEVTLLIQVKKGNIGAANLRKNIFGQLVEVFTRKLDHSSHNPRRIFLITSGKMTENSWTFINNWNEQIPIPIEVFDIDEIASLLYDHYNSDLNQIKKAAKRGYTIIPSETEEIKLLNKEKTVIISRKTKKSKIN